MLRARCLVPILALGAALAGPSSAAHAAVYCLDTTHASCTTTVNNGGGSALATALTSAKASAGSDTIRLGPFVYLGSGGFVADGGGADITIIGAGRSATTLRYTGADSSSPTIEAFGGAIALTSLRVEAPTSGLSVLTAIRGSDGLALNDVAATAATNGNLSTLDIIVLTGSASLSQVTATGGGASAVDISGPGDVSIDASSFTAGRFPIYQRSKLTGTTTITGTKLFTTAAENDNGAGVFIDGGAVALRQVDIVSFDDGIRQQCGAASSTLTARRLTLDVDTGAPALQAFCSTAGRTTTGTVSGTLITPGSTIYAGQSASLALSQSRYNGPASVSAPDGGVFTPTGDITTPPTYSPAGSHIPAPNSGLVDALPVTAAGYTGGELDADGRFLRRDGDGDGKVREDIGAHEYQPPAIPLPAGNLLSAPGGESPGGGAIDAVQAPVPPSPWVRTAGNLTTGNYGASFFSGRIIGDALGGDGSMFLGGPLSAQNTATATQTVDVSGSAAGIDAGGATATLSALLGGFGSEDDAAAVTASFRSATDTALGASTVGPVTRDDRESSTLLLPRTATAAIPAGTRSIVVQLNAQRITLSDSYNDASIDSVALTTSVPAPATTTGPGTTTTTTTTTTGTTTGTNLPLTPAFTGVTLKGGRYRLDPKGALRLPVTCPATARTACTGTLALTTKVTKRVKGKKRTTTLTLGSATVKITAGRSATVRIMLSKVKRRLVKTSGLKTTLTASTRDAATALARKTTAAVTVLPPAKKAKKPKK